MESTPAPPNLPALAILQPGHKVSRPPRSRLASLVRSLLLRLYRLAIVVVIVLLVYRHQTRLRIEGDRPITLEEVRLFLPTADHLTVDNSDRLGEFVYDPHAEQIGYVLRTAPISDGIRGYAGPTDTLIVLDAEMKVVGIKIRRSTDTVKHVGDVMRDEYFMSTWNGKTWDEVAGMEPRAAHIEGVSGASLTSMGMANAIQHRFRAATDVAGKLPAVHVGVHEIALAVIIVLGLLFSFTHLRSRTWLRRAYQLVLIGYLGFWNGQLIGQSLLWGWAVNGLPWRMAPGLVMLAAAALVVPWTTRRPLYCAQLCPHGAAQEWIGRLSRWRLKIPRSIELGLRWLPGLLVALCLVVTIFSLPLDLASIEPFDAYLIRTAGAATITIFIVGLIASAFVPMAYCKYGCPTGYVLSLVRSHGQADRFGTRDLAAGALALLAVALVWGYPTLYPWVVH